MVASEPKSTVTRSQPLAPPLPQSARVPEGTTQPLTSLPIGAGSTCAVVSSGLQPEMTSRAWAKFALLVGAGGTVGTPTGVPSRRMSFRQPLYAVAVTQGSITPSPQ